jgi:cold shock CspA family protein
MNHSIKNIVSLNKTTNFGFITNTDNVFLLISDVAKFRELYSTIQILLNLFKDEFFCF